MSPLPTLWGSQIIVRVSSAAPDAEPVWVDVSDYVTFRIGNISIDAGLQTGADAIGAEPATASLAWRNDDHRFSDPAGPYPWFKEARRVRVEEVIEGSVFCLFDGYLGPPSHAPAIDSTDGSVSFLTTAAAAADRLSRLRSAPPFISTLTQFILFNAAANGLSSFWPLVDTTGLDGVAVNGITAQAPLSVERVTGVGSGDPVGTPSITIGGGAAVTADDAATLLLSPALNATGTAIVREIFPTGPVNPMTVTGSSLTFSVWVNYEDVVPSSNLFFQIENRIAGAVPADDLLDLMNIERNGGVWDFGATLESTNVFATATCSALPSWKWNLITLRLTLPSGLIELWVNDSPAVSTTLGGPGTVPNSQTFTGFALGEGMQGALYGLQVCTGSTFTHDAHLAQYDMGRTGLEQQLTGERIHTILDYAGVPDSVRDVDAGVARMSIARLAGKDPLTCLEEARRTEAGRLFMDNGRVQFHDRIHVFNV